jgi:predicted RNA-binding protein with PUA-like domain
MPQQEPSYWLMKSEPDAYSIDTLENDGVTLWDGIRNYQARNFMRNMNKGDKVFFYHSNCKPPGIVGLMEVIDLKIVDPTQFDKDSKYFDPKSKPESPTWDCVKVKFISKSNKILSLPELKILFSEDDLLVVKKGIRLSIIPVRKDIARILLKKI